MALAIYIARHPAHSRIGHNDKGLGIIESDDSLSALNPTVSDGSAPTGLIPGFITIAKTTNFPDTSVNKPFVDLHGKKLPLSDDSGVTCRIVDFPPVPAEMLSSDTVNFMHRTQSVDFGVVLQGKIWLVMDSGDEREMGVGDIAVQRGTNHVSLRSPDP